MHILSFLDNIQTGRALALGFENPNSPKPEFIAALVAAGPSGLVATLDVDKSSFEVRDNMVKNVQSAAFGKMVGNISVHLTVGTTGSNVSVDIGTFATLVEGGNKVTIAAIQPNGKDGQPLKTKAGEALYNFRAVTPVPYKEGETIKMLRAFAEKLPVTAPGG